MFELCIHCSLMKGLIILTSFSLIWILICDIILSCLSYISYICDKAFLLSLVFWNQLLVYVVCIKAYGSFVSFKDIVLLLWVAWWFCCSKSCLYLVYTFLCRILKRIWMIFHACMFALRMTWIIYHFSASDGILLAFPLILLLWIWVLTFK